VLCTAKEPTHAQPWKSGASASRQAPQNKPGFSHRGRFAWERHNREGHDFSRAAGTDAEKPTHTPPWKAALQRRIRSAKTQPGFSPVEFFPNHDENLQVFQNPRSNGPWNPTFHKKRERWGTRHLKPTAPNPCSDVEERRFSAASGATKQTGLQPPWTF
jgi:hypothetical protein